MRKQEWDILQLIKVRTQLARKLHETTDTKVKIEVKCYLAEIDNVLDDIEEHIIEKCLVRILCDIYSVH